MLSLPLLAGRVFNTPLLMTRAKLDAVLSVIMPRLAGANLPLPLDYATANYDVTPDGIALIPVFGTLVKRTSGLEAQSGLTSYTTISQQLDAALNDQRVNGILLDIDSPGGEVSGIFDLTDQIFAARHNKPIWSVADEEAFSAAYAIAAATERIYVPRTGGVGSIGVIAMHLDQSKADAKAGLSYDAIYAGEHKNDYSPHVPLSDPARETLQAEVDRVYSLFTETVARYRGTNINAITDTEAQLFFGQDAINAGLADRLGTLIDAQNDMRSFLTKANASFNPAKFSAAKPQKISAIPHQQKGKSMSNPIPADGLPADQEVELNDPQTANEGDEANKDITAEDDKALENAIQAKAQAYVAEVTQLCQLAGLPDKALGFLAQGLALDEIRTALLTARAISAETAAISNHIPAASTANQPSIDTAAIYAARNNQQKGQ